MTLSNEVCFCCLRGADEIGGLTEEDVFPRWLVRRFPHLKKETYNYFATVPVKLGAIKIPACRSCNNEYLSSCLEKPVSQASQSYREAAELSRNVWSSWAAKVIYGIYLRGISLRSDQRDPLGAPLVPKDFVRSLQLVRTLSILAAPRFELLPAGAAHTTVAILPCKESTVQPPVEFIDVPAYQAMAMRLGSVGLIACVGDGGLTERILTSTNFYMDYTQKPLSRCRFREGAAAVFYQRSRLTWTPEPLFLGPGGDRMACLINTMTLSGGPLQSPFRAEDARAMFASVFHIPYANVRYTRKQGIIVDLPGDHPLADGATQ